MWYCAHTKPNSEFEARMSLESRGFTAFLPCYLVRYASRNIRAKLLFRNYIFIDLKDAIDWPIVNQMSGILHMLTHSPPEKEKPDQPWYMMPSAVASEAIEELRQQSLSYDEIRKNGKSKIQIELITAGCYVRVLAGPLKDDPMAQRALVDWEDKYRAGLVMQMFNQKSVIEFYKKDLELVPEQVSA